MAKMKKEFTEEEFLNGAVVESFQFLEAGFADSDDPFMTYQLAKHALYGDDWNEPDPKKARFYCEKAAKLGSFDAMMRLAEFNLKGVGGKRDLKRAWRLLNEAFEKGVGENDFDYTLGQ